MCNWSTKLNFARYKITFEAYDKVCPIGSVDIFKYFCNLDLDLSDKPYLYGEMHDKLFLCLKIF